MSPLPRLIWTPAKRGTLPGPAGGVALILQEGRIVARAVLRALGEPVKAAHAGFASTTIVLEDGRELAYYWCDDSIALMAMYDAGRDAELQPQTVRLMDRATYQAYRAAHPSTGSRGPLPLPDTRLSRAAAWFRRPCYIVAS